MNSNFDWTIKNQFLLAEIYREQRYKIRLAKNRIEKLRARQNKKYNNNI
jgi:hypothetical protein